MKTFKTLLLLLAAATLLTSCSRAPSLSITKRHYLPGYHIDWNWPSKTTTQAMPVPYENPGKDFVHASASIDDPGIAPDLIAAQELISEAGIDSKAVQTKKKSSSSSSWKNIADKLNEPVVFPEKINISNSGDGKNKIAVDSAGLIWAIVLILLILWLVGILLGGLGLGGLIYLLLVVALVLAILKLLGAI